MSQLVDLHMHTLHSDGICSVKDLIELAKSRGVEIMSINDHDTVKGVMEMKTLEVSGITVLCGIEMSNSFNGSGGIHITGYFPPNADFASLQAILEERVSQKRSSHCECVIHRIERAKKMVELLSGDGIQITWEDLENHCKNCLPSRPRIAEVLVQNGYGKTVAEVFDRYLTNRSK